jgi:hypothetical protein
MSNRLTIIGALVLTSWCLASLVLAQTTAHQIPYQGRLDLDGVAMNGLFDFQIELYSDDALGDCGTPPVIAGQCVWADTFTDVQVVGGDFSVALGSGAEPLDDAVWQNLEVFLAIRVAPAGETLTPLTGRQRILAVPMAARADTAKEFHVVGGLTTHGILPRYQAWASQGVGDGGAGIYNDSVEAALMLVGNDAGPGTTRRVGIWDELTVHGGAIVTGNLRADGPVAANGGLSTSPRLVELRYFDLGNAGNISTGYSTADWDCIIGSVRMTNGDIFEGGTSNPYFAYTYVNGPLWYVTGDFASHVVHERTEVGVVCFRTGISSRVSWF